MIRSKRHKANLGLFDKNKLYTVKEAIDLLKKAQAAKFDETVEAHFHLNINPEKSEQQVRSGTDLPNGTGKSVKIAVFTEDSNKIADAKKAGAEITGGESLIEKIRTSGTIAVDVTVATPDMMPKLAKIAKILGPRGLMPNPKNETVTDEVEKVVLKLKKGKVNFKSDKSGNIHVPIGKLSFTEQALEENYDTLKKTIDKLKPSGVKGKFIKTITLSSTVGLGVKIS
jgi:large subunit ribosomal protein L1